MELAHPAPLVQKMFRRLQFPCMCRYTPQLNVNKRGQHHCRRTLEPRPAPEEQGEQRQVKRPSFIVDSDSRSFIGEDQQTIFTAQTVKLQRLDREFMAAS